MFMTSHASTEVTLLKSEHQTDTPTPLANPVGATNLSLLTLICQQISTQWYMSVVMNSTSQ